jgi:hypothetical protein
LLLAPLLLALGPAPTPFAAAQNRPATPATQPLVSHPLVTHSLVTHSLVTHSIDESKLVTLAGSVHPLALPQNDRGAVADSFPAPRMLLLLNRPPEREAALQEFLRDAHTPGSAGYHQWLTPEEFGAQFGLADADVQAATAWLAGHGLQVTKIARSRQFIEFSGTAGGLRSAFHTEIHRYETGGETHYANANALQIPAALAGLIRGVSPLNDFRAQPQVQVLGQAQIAPGPRPATPLWTTPNQFGTSSPYEYLVAPEDYQTQYDLAPLYQAGVNGSGQTIGIINESNIDLSLVSDFQSLFGIAANTPQVIIDGDDPGNLNGVDIEAYLDVEMSGAIAPQATVDLYIASAGNLVDPLEMSAFRAVEDNQASVLSVSFGQCESVLGEAGNQFWFNLWEQAAAQGQTVLVASGDSGPTCDFDPLWVSGLASTPWNVAVGGTDFYYSDYATGGASAASLWNTTNDADHGSLKAPLPEQPWNDAFGLNIVADEYQRGEFDSAGGGASNCITINSDGSCAAGYAKPAWQSVPGVPADGARDIPDVSLFAANGANLSAITICAIEGQCVPLANKTVYLTLVGGTSASAPAMAGIMALVDQKYGRQGQADFTLYALAAQKPAVFHDITVGNNSAPCGSVLGTNCVQQANGYNGTPQYAAGPGYDLASGIGSVDANLLVTDWSEIAYQPTTTSLKLSSTKITHGAPVTISTSVAPSSGSGKPSGDVAILTTADLPTSQGQTFLTLNGGNASTTADDLPGGSYQVTGRYGGDSIFAASTSQPVSLTVAPEASNLNFSMTSGTTSIASGGTIAYGAPFQLSVRPTGANAAAGKSDGLATGSAKFTVDSTTATVALNSAGIASWAPPPLAPGAHTASASYSGDSSFNASSNTPVPFSVTPGAVALNDDDLGQYTFQTTPTGEYLPGIFMNTGSALQVTVTAQGQSTLGVSASQIPAGTAAPTGTIKVCLGTYPNLGNVCDYQIAYTQTASLSPLNGPFPYESLGVATFPNLANGQYYVSVAYSGDGNWQAWGLQDLRSITVEALPTYAASTTTLAISPASISGAQTATVTVIVSGSGNAGTSPTGEVDFYNDGIFLSYIPKMPSTPGTTSTFVFQVVPAWFLSNGSNSLTAVYQGDGANGPSVSNVVELSSTRYGDFTLAPQAPQLTVQPGAAATFAVNLTSVSGFNGAVALTCAPSSSQFGCSVSPGSLTVNGSATAAVTVTASLPTAAQALPMRQAPGRRPSRWPVTAAALAIGFLFFGRGGRARSLGAMLAVLCALAGFSACGGAVSTGTPPPPQGSTPAGAYAVVITGSANGVIHNAKIAVVVP